VRLGQHWFDVALLSAFEQDRADGRRKDVNIEEFLLSVERFAVEGQPEADALRQDDALQESALADFRMNFVESTAWILLDCRGSLHVPEANTAVLVLLGAHHASWQLPGTGTFAWQTIIDWKVSEVSGGIELRIGLLAGGDVVVRAVRGEYFVGDVPGGDDAPPDFTTATHAQVRAGMAAWSSEFSPRGASFR